MCALTNVVYIGNNVKLHHLFVDVCKWQLHPVRACKLYQNDALNSWTSCQVDIVSTSLAHSSNYICITYCQWKLQPNWANGKTKVLIIILATVVSHWTWYIWVWEGRKVGGICRMNSITSDSSLTVDRSSFRVSSMQLGSLHASNFSALIYRAFLGRQSSRQFGHIHWNPFNLSANL